MGCASEAHGGSTTTDAPNDDKPGFVAVEPEHCFACFCLIRPGQTCYLTIEQDILCADCALVEEIIRMRDDLAAEVKRDRLVVRRSRIEMEREKGLSRYEVFDDPDKLIEIGIWLGL